MTVIQRFRLQAISCLIGILFPCVSAGNTSRELRIFKNAAFSVNDLIDGANHFIELGSKDGIQELKRLANDTKYAEEVRASETLGFSVGERIAWICRIVFEPEAKKSIRRPAFGAHTFPPCDDKSWPLYPLVQSGPAFWVLSAGYNGAGFPEFPSSYIDYCAANGRFRAVKVPLVTKEEAAAQLNAILTSPAWKALVWKGRRLGSSWELKEADSISYLKGQLPPEKK